MHSQCAVPAGSSKAQRRDRAWMAFPRAAPGYTTSDNHSNDINASYKNDHKHTVPGRLKPTRPYTTSRTPEHPKP